MSSMDTQRVDPSSSIDVHTLTVLLFSLLSRPSSPPLISAGWSVGTHTSLFGVEEEAAARSLEEKAAVELELGVVDGDRDAAHQRALALESTEASEEDRLVARRNFKFHLVMASCAMYMAMLLTNWGSTAEANDIDYQGGVLTGQAYDLSVETVWIKFVSQWLTMILYGWSLLAPVVCKNRDFS
jgi:hypothetical protein